MKSIFYLIKLINLYFFELFYILNTGVNAVDINLTVEHETSSRQREICIEIHHILNEEIFSNKSRRILVTALLREFTKLGTVNGVYRNIPYWSKDAINIYNEISSKYKNSLTQISNKLSKQLIHEHILPIKECLNLFDSQKYPIDDIDYIREIVYNFALVAIITIDEDKRLNKRFKDSVPNSFYITRNSFDRYSSVGIELKRVVWNEGAKSIKELQNVDLDKSAFENELDSAIKFYESSIIKDLSNLVDSTFSK